MTAWEAESDGVTQGARAIVVFPDLASERRGRTGRDAAGRVAEVEGLANAIGLDIVEAFALPVRQVRAATLIGPGQTSELAERVAAEEIEVVVLDTRLSPVQQRNLERAVKAKVIDRTALILEIFGERARTAEGRLQVELAHLDYQSGRLVRSWTHLERQRGGFGFLGGPGETQIEADRRMIRDRMARLRRELEEVRRTRGLHRQQRDRAPWPVVALVGYTNAGKSTLFNRLTGSDVMAEDLLFATLDPTMREIGVPGLAKVILADTVGFVSDLPTELVAAFRATLEEVLAADLIVHVRDIAHPDTDAQRADVLSVLAGLGVNPDAGEGPPMLEAWNKLDLLDKEEAARVGVEAERRDGIVPLSAVTGEGVEHLQNAVAEALTAANRTRELRLSSRDGATLAWLYERGEVLKRHDGEDGSLGLSVRLSEADWCRYESRFTPA